MATADQYAEWIVKNESKKGTPEFETVAQAYRLALKEDQPLKEAGNALNQIPKQLGLTARYGLESLGNVAEIGSEPIRYITDRLTGSVGKTMSAGRMATKLADFIGLPSPETPMERVVGEAAKMTGSAGALGGGAGALAKQVPAQAAKALNFLAANPIQQLSSAAGAGLAGGASREAGGSPVQQTAAAVFGGLAGAGAGSLAQAGANIAKRAAGFGPTNQQLDIEIGRTLRGAGVDYSTIPERVKQSMRAELKSALETGKELDPAAVSRLLAFREAGVQPTRGMITQNPVQITREMNLAKIGANSMDDSLQGLAAIQNRNNAQLIENLNTLGANRGDPLQAGEALRTSVLGRQAGLRGAEQSAWDLAKTSPGYKAPISSNVISDINAALGDEGLMPFMNPQISRYMEAFQTGRPFTPQDYRNLQSMLSREVAKGGNEGAAAGLARKVLENAELQPPRFVPSGELATGAQASAMRNIDQNAADSLAAVNAARAATKRAYAFEDSSPVVRAALSQDADPERIASRFIINGTAKDAADIVRLMGDPTPVKNSVLTYLKETALNKASDETGKFSQSAFNSALNKIGDKKLSILFTPEEIKALRVNGRVAALMQSQPVGSAVNNSNTGALLLGRMNDLLGGVPVVGPMVSPAIDRIGVNIRTRNAQNLMPGLVKEQPPIYQPFILPGIAASGLLASP